MLRHTFRLTLCLSLICCVLRVSAQQPAASGIVPQLVKFGGVLTDVNSKPLTGTVGVTFSLYKDQEGGAPLWMETQNVQPDKAGHYSITLGSATSHGLPASTFASGEARWLGVQAQGQAEQARTLLMSVPYALKALDAETIGGKPLSALQLAAPNGGSSSAPPARIKRPWPIPSPALPGRGARRISFLCLIAAAEQRQSKIRLSRKAARPSVSPAAQSSPDLSVP